MCMFFQEVRYDNPRQNSIYMYIYRSNIQFQDYVCVIIIYLGDLLRRFLLVVMWLNRNGEDIVLAVYMGGGGVFLCVIWSLLGNIWIILSYSLMDIFILFPPCLYVSIIYIPSKRNFFPQNNQVHQCLPMPFIEETEILVAWSPVSLGDFIWETNTWSASQ